MEISVHVLAWSIGLSVFVDELLILDSDLFEVIDVLLHELIESL